MLSILRRIKMATTSIKPILIPEGVTLSSDKKFITAAGKLGEMTLELHQDVDFIKEEGGFPAAGVDLERSRGPRLVPSAGLYRGSESPHWGGSAIAAIRTWS